MMGLLSSNATLFQASLYRGSAAPLGEPSSPDLRVAVCVVGQLSRLQLDSLVEHFLIPNRLEGHTVDVVVRLSDTMLSVNDKDLASGKWSKKGADDIAEFLSHASRQVSVAIRDPPDLMVIHSPIPHPLTILLSALPAPELPRWVLVGFSVLILPIGAPFIPKLRRHFVDTMSKAKVEREAEEQALRHLGHVRQFDAVGLCMDQVEAWEQEEGLEYDVILKVRDDSYLFDKLMVAQSHKEAAFFVDCMEWGGLNDKHFIGGRHSVGRLLRNLLPDYYARPKSDYYYLGPRKKLSFPRNIETFYYREAVLLDIPTHTVDINRIPFVTRRPHSTGSCYKATPTCVPCGYYKRFSTVQEARDHLCPGLRTSQAYATRHHHINWCACMKGEPEMCDQEWPPEEKGKGK
ncbi:unnamed protein product [Chrysoparadoxa australica]